MAGITPVNANVSYELGYARALGKPTVLLAERGQQLPVDVGRMAMDLLRRLDRRTAHVDEQLRRHLIAIA